MLGAMRVLSWGAAPHEGRAMLRPDGQWQLRLPEDQTGWPALLATLPAEITTAVLALGEGHAATVLPSFGFAAVRTEQLWEVPIARVGPVIVSPSHTMASVTACDLARVAELDNAVRAQIPGAERWLGSVSDLEESLTDDEFDPELYLVAVHQQTGSYDGLVRVWNRAPAPRLGCVGVRPEWRRTRLGPALLGAIAHRLRRRGVTQLVTETDITNRDSHSLAAHHGAVPRGRTVEWVLQTRTGR